MSKKLKKGILGSAFVGFLSGLGIGVQTYDKSIQQEEHLTPVQVESVYSGQIIRQPNLHQETPGSLEVGKIEEMGDEERFEQSLISDSTLPLLERKEDLDVIHKKLLAKKSLSSQEYQFLLSIISHLNELSPNGSQDHLLTQKLKDIRYLGNILKRQRAFQNLEREVETIISEYSHVQPNDFLSNIRNKDKALSIEQGLLTLDYTKINSNLARLIEDYSRRYDLNPRLVSVICTMENNFGLQRISVKNAKGMCQTMVSLVKYYYPNYASLNESNQLFAHFVTTFKYLEDLKKKFNLSIGYYDDSFEHKEDFLKATIFYHDGASNVIERNGRIIPGTNGQKYVLKALQSFKIPVMILNSSQG